MSLFFRVSGNTGETLENRKRTRKQELGEIAGGKISGMLTGK